MYGTVKAFEAARTVSEPSTLELRLLNAEARVRDLYDRIERLERMLDERGTGSRNWRD